MGLDRPHILVVDDEPPIRDLLQKMLQQEGYRVTVRGDGASALEDIRGGGFQALITDLKMPRMGGLDLIRAARGVQPDLGTIVITAYASTETAVNALRLGADDFVTKPFALDDLRRVVSRVLGARRMLSQERDAVDQARAEAEELRQRSRDAESALADARRDLDVSQRDLDLSRRDLERRVRDLEFVADLQRLLTQGEDLQRILETTARILTVRFGAQLTRIEVALPTGVHTAQQVSQDASPALRAAIGRDLIERARVEPSRVAREVVLGFDRPLEVLAAPLDLSFGPAGGLTLVRGVPPGEDPGDAFLFSLVPRALAVGVEADLQRRAAVKAALDVATGILEALEGRGTLFRGHADRVARMARAVAEEMGLSARLQGVIETAGRLHDVGEIAVPDGMLQRQGPLSDDERELIRQHPAIGARILAPFGEAAAFVRHHKERPDGFGYPDGLTGTAIPIGSAIIGVTEAYDAMTHHRAYRPSRSRKEALTEIARLSGTQFLPEAADALLRVPRERLGA